MNNRTRVASLVCVFIGAAAALALPRPPLPPLPESQRLNVWGFDGTNWLSHPDAAPLAFDNVSLVESWSGYAARLAGSQPALLVLPEQTPSGKVNLPMTGPGTVRFWFAPEWSSAGIGTGPGDEARLLEVGAWSAQGAQGWWSLSINPAGTELRFLAHGNEATVEILHASIDWCAGEWHQVALAWSPQNQAVLYVDGQRVAEAAGVALEPLTQFAGVAGFCLGSDVQGGNLVQGQFEQLCTFGRACADEELARDFQFNASLAARGPITPEEEQAWLNNLVQSSALRPESTSNQAEMSAANYACDLWLEIGLPVNGNVPVTLHNTTPGYTYQLWSKQDLNDATWNVEQTLTATSGQVETGVAMLNRPALFFLAIQIIQPGYVIDADFEGIASTEAGGEGVPDSMGAIGPSNFVEIVNGRIAIFDKVMGARVAGEAASLTEFFGAQGHVLYDPRIAYDHEAHGWVACVLDRDSASLRLAIRGNTDPVPLSGWVKHNIPIPLVNANARPDYDTLGLDKNGIYVAVLQHQYFGEQHVIYGQTIVAIKKQDIYAPGNLIYTLWNIDTGSTDFRVWIVQPAVNFDDPPAGGYAWLVAKGPPVHGSPYRGGAIYYRRLSWNLNGSAQLVDPTWQLSDTTTIYRDYFDLEDGTVRAPQLDDGAEGPIINLNLTGSRLMMAVIRNNALWTCHHIGLDGPDPVYNSTDTTGSAVNRSGVQWLKFAVGSGGGSLPYSAHGRIYDDCAQDASPRWYYFPSLMVNPTGDIVLGFSGASADSYLSAFYSWRLANGTKADRPILIQSGQFHYPYYQVGDYSSTTLDPVDSSFWTVQEFAKDPTAPPSFDTWGTRITQLRLSP